MTFHACCQRYNSSRSVISKFIQAIVHFIIPLPVGQILANRFKHQSTHLKNLERQSEWLRRYHSPLRILSLTENVAEVKEIRRKYKELTLRHHPDHGGSREDLENIQVAYKMLMDPKSIWYLDGNSTELASHVGKMFHRKRQVQFFGFFVWIILFYILCVAGTKFLVPFMEGLLKLIDPKFFRFMLNRESIDDQELQDGKEVEHDPVKLAPMSIRKLKYPGKYLDDL